MRAIKDRLSTVCYFYTQPWAIMSDRDDNQRTEQLDFIFTCAEGSTHKGRCICVQNEVDVSSENGDSVSIMMIVHDESHMRQDKGVDPSPLLRVLCAFTCKIIIDRVEDDDSSPSFFAYLGRIDFPP